MTTLGFMADDATIEVIDNQAENRFEIAVNGTRAGFLTYHRAPHGAWSLLHTEVDDAYTGRGLGSQLIGVALGRLRDQGIAVLPYCPFVRAYLTRHPDQTEIVPADRRAEFGL